MRYVKIFAMVALAGSVWLQARATQSSPLVWSRSTDQVSADIHDEPLGQLLQDIARQTGWHIMLEPGTDHATDVKFRNLTGGEALKKLLGDLNYALVPEKGGPATLYVFTTTMQAATLPVKIKSSHVPNELMVKLKAGVDPDTFAKGVGAKVIGRNDKLHIYLLQFDNAAATDAAYPQLADNNSDVEDVNYNNIYDAPPVPQALAAASALPMPTLTLNPSSTTSSSPLIGLIDTIVQPSGTAVDKIILPQTSVVDVPSTSSSTAVNSDSYGEIQPMSDANTSTSTVPTHGTAMAQAMGYALSQINGGQTSVKILPVNVYESGDTTTSWDVALGVKYAVDHGANFLNLSLGGTDDSSILDEIIQQALAKGVVIFAAAGNTPVTAPTYPAAIPGVNAVTALGAPGELASYANHGSFVEMALPGTSFVVLGSQEYIVQGTSPATATATGIAAGNKAAKGVSWSQIKTAMDEKFPVPTVAVSQ